jgi:hypothetical protein
MKAVCLKPSTIVGKFEPMPMYKSKGKNPVGWCLYVEMDNGESLALVDVSKVFTEQDAKDGVEVLNSWAGK